MVTLDPTTNFGDRASIVTSRRTHRRLRLRVVVCAAAVVVVAATLAVTNAPEAAAGPSKAEVIRAYAPLVHLHPNEDFMPMSASRFVALSELKWSHGGNCQDHTKVSRGQIDAAKLGGGGYHDQAEVSDLPACEVADRDYSSQELTRPWDSKNPIPHQPEGFFLEFPDSQRAGDLGSAPVYYEYVHKKSVTFWFFYAFNDAPGKEIFNHEGDWEKISIQLDSTNRARRVALFQHDGHCVLDFKDVKGYRGHPEVYAAIGTHATYPMPGRWPLPAGQVDRTAGEGGGLRWETYRREADVHQPWYNFGGAWGEVGGTATPPAGTPLPAFQSERTGPLGPRSVNPPKLGAPKTFDGRRCPLRP